VLRRSQQFYFQILQVLDALLLCLALWLAYLLRVYLVPEIPLVDRPEIGPFNNYVWIYVILLPLGPLVLEMWGFYRAELLHGWASILRMATEAIILIVFAIIGFLFFLKISEGLISRGVLVVFAPVAIFLLTVRVLAFQWWWRSGGHSEMGRKHLLLVGTGEQRQRWRDDLKRIAVPRWVIRSELDVREMSLEQFIERLHEESIDIVIFNMEWGALPQMQQAILACELEGVEAWVTTDFVRTSLARAQLDELAGHPLIVFRSTPENSWPFLAKAALDRVGSLILLVLLSPLLLGVAFLIWKTSGRPILFSQKRSGRYGRPFTMYKFRTMVTNAEQKREELKVFNQMTGPVFKVEKDPRITPLGAWLRKLSLDELPQIWNVFRGEMSLVGPRPLPIYETESFTDLTQRRRMSMKPGLTCLWQISGRSSITDFKDWVRLDLKYIDSWSFWLDIKILLLTIPVVLWGRGAK
jgi:exopolysaccharide biosynthesis polyprenyl glycosylphosphotransferase